MSSALSSSRRVRPAVWLAASALVALAVPITMRARAARTRDPRAVAPSASAAGPSLESDGLPASALGNDIRAYLQLARVIGPGARTNSERALARLKPQAGPVTDAVVAAFDRLPVKAHRARSSLVSLLTYLEHPGAEPLLGRIAESQARARSEEAESHATAADPEVLLRMTAVRGLVQLATAGSATAKETLLRVVGHPDVSTRYAAARGLFRAFPHDTGLQQALAARVRPDERFLIDGTERVMERPPPLAEAAHAD
jgi:hypothetical protein